MIVPGTDDESRRRQLQLTRRRATWLLAVVAAVFLGATLAGARGWLGYLQATAEASLVGGLADWFAVTALFRRPLGLPIPHTAIVVERKEQFAATLGSFVRGSFLTPDNVAARVQAARIVPRAAAWLAAEANADRVAGEVLAGAVGAVDLVEDEDVHRLLEAALRDRLDTVDIAKLAGRLLQFLLRDRRHGPAVDTLLRAALAFLQEHRAELRSRFGGQSPWWLPDAVEDRIFERVVDGACAVLAEMADNPEHPYRVEIDARLDALAADLTTSPQWRERGEQLKAQALDQPEVREWVASMWEEAKHTLREQGTAPQSSLRRGLAGTVAAAGRRLQADTVLGLRAEEAAERVARYLASRLDAEAGAIITSTVARWDAHETAGRLELFLGPDLQFVRINGTVVGGAAGLLLYTVSRLVR